MLDAIVSLPSRSTCAVTFGLSNLKDFIYKQAGEKFSIFCSPHISILGSGQGQVKNQSETCVTPI